MIKETITISSSKGEKKIQIDKIVFCRQYLVGTLIELTDGNHYLLKERLDEMIEFLEGPNFVQISSRELINIEYIEALFSDQVVLLNNKVFKINSAWKNRLVQKLNQETWI